MAQVIAGTPLARQRARVAAAARDARGAANTAPAVAARDQQFIDSVLAYARERGETLTEAELAKRVKAARKEHFARLAYASLKAKAARKSTS